MFYAGTVGCECANTGMLSLAQHPRRACLAFSSSNVSWHSGITTSTSPGPPRPPYQPDAFHILICLATVLDECPPPSLSPPCGNGQSTLILKSVPVASSTRHWHAFIYCAGFRFTWLSYPRIHGRNEIVLARALVPAETVVVFGLWLTT